jgi:signal transduction histidine kinase
MTDRTTRRVLVIEDDADTCANLRDILELDGYQVEAAGSIAEALRRETWAEFTAIILDRKLPDGTAEELLPRLRQLAPAAAVIVATGYGDLDGAIAAIRNGAADYILKPINADLLRNRLASIASLKEAQERLLQSERLAAIGQMMAGLAHESRNALQRSQACLEMIALDVQDMPETLQMVEDAQKAQDYLHHLYEEVRGYAAPITIKRERCHLGELLDDVWLQLAISREGRQAHLDHEENGVDLCCEVDRHSISQVFRNILENALSACADPVEVRTEWSEAESNGRPALVISARDNGPGLTPEARRNIFEPFYTTKTQGTGLGMAIAKRIIEAHGGQIEIGPVDGRGAEILIRLPR